MQINFQHSEISTSKITRINQGFLMDFQALERMDTPNVLRRIIGDLLKISLKPSSLSEKKSVIVDDSKVKEYCVQYPNFSKEFILIKMYQILLLEQFLVRAPAEPTARQFMLLEHLTKMKRVRSKRKPLGLLRHVNTSDSTLSVDVLPFILVTDLSPGVLI